jgi:flagellar protein FliS
MTRNRPQLAYQESAVRNASPAELVIILYDILTRDLQGAIEAMEAGKIEARTAKLKHGFLVLQQLEGTLDLEGGGEFATNLSRFYSMIRGQMMTAQFQKDPAILRQLIQLLFNVREAWVEVSSRQNPMPVPAPEVVPPVRQSGEEPETKTSSWKA